MEPTSLSRRSLLIKTSVGIGLCACSGITLAADNSAKSGLFDAGLLSDFGQGCADTFAHNDPHIFIVRQKDRLFVSSSICTHKRCMIERTGAGYSCDCHHSKYTPDGVPVHGPARKPLPRMAVTIDDRKHVMVELTRKFEQAQWDDPKAYVIVAE
jgi:Rieske Fe-S protein